MGLAILRIAVPGARNKRVIVCERGLVQIGRRIGSKQVEVVYWSDILTIKRFFHEYFIVYKINKVLELEITYQNIYGLVELIRSQSRKV